MSLRDLAYTMRTGYRYWNHNPSPVAIVLNRLFDDVAASREAILIELPVHFSDAPIENVAPISE
jgi:hypothetical protein